MATEVWNGAEFIEVPAAPYTASGGAEALIDGAPAALDTLNELAAALGDELAVPH